jgi:hypothetical protein
VTIQYQLKVVEDRLAQLDLIIDRIHNEELARTLIVERVVLEIVKDELNRKDGK